MTEDFEMNPDEMLDDDDIENTAENTDENADDDADFEAMLQAALGTTEHDSIDRAVEQLEPRKAVQSGFKSGYVAVVGVPNVGKSTLVNRILGEKIAIVSPKPQTTRLRQLGILTTDAYQIVFIDTPGIHQIRDELGTFMVEVAKSALDDADVILFVVDASRRVGKEDMQVIDYLNQVDDPEKVVIVLNKLDAAKDPGKFKATYENLESLLPDAEIASVTALDGYKVPELVEQIVEMLPEGPLYYPVDQVSDIPIREISAEIIREKVLYKTHEEVPHSIAVEINEFKQRKDDLIYIDATVFTERDGQKGIIIGKGGEMIKAISTAARQEIEAFTENRVYLELRVKVLHNWRKDEAALRRFGYRL